MTRDPDKVHPAVPYQRHVFVCASGRTCPTRGGEEVCGRLRGMAKAAGITDRIRVNESGCMNQCAHGPVLVVYPEGTWYAGVSPEDAGEVFETTVLRGEVVPRLLHRGPGDPA